MKDIVYYWPYYDIIYIYNVSQENFHFLEGIPDYCYMGSSPVPYSIKLGYL